MQLKKVTSIILAVLFFVSVLPNVFVSAEAEAPFSEIDFEGSTVTSSPGESPRYLDPVNKKLVTTETDYFYYTWSPSASKHTIKDKNGSDTKVMAVGAGNRNTWGSGGGFIFNNGSDLYTVEDKAIYRITYDVFLKGAPLGAARVAAGYGPTFAYESGSYSRVSGMKTVVDGTGVLCEANSADFTYYVNGEPQRGTAGNWYTVVDEFAVSLPAKSESVPVNDALGFYCLQFGENMPLYVDNIKIEKLEGVSFNFGNGRSKMVAGAVGDPLEYPEASREGYEFLGWYTIDGDPFTDTEITAENVNTVVYAKFKYSGDVFTMNFEGSAAYPKNAYYAYSCGGENFTTVQNYGWNNHKLLGDGTVEVRNGRTWGEPSITMVYDEKNGNLFEAEPLSNYKVTVRYKVTDLKPNVAFALQIGFGFSKENAQDIGNRTLWQLGQGTVNETEVMSEFKTFTSTVSSPEWFDEITPCIGIRTSFSNSGAVVFDSITVEKIKSDSIVVSEGTSKLTDAAVEKAGSQAIRAYFAYEADKDGKIEFDGEMHAVTSRGMLYKAKSNHADMSVSNMNKNGVLGYVKYTDTDKVWDYDSETGKITFSAYFSGFKPDDTREISLRGFLTLDNGLVVYSDMVYTSIASITEKLDKINKDSGKEKITLMMVIGQSNAQGAGYSESREAELAAKKTGGEFVITEEPTSNGYGQVYISKSAINSLDLRRDLYEQVKNRADDTGADGGYGGYPAAYATEWYNLTGEKVVILRCSLGATSLPEWCKDPSPEKFKEYKTSAEGGQYWLYNNAVQMWNRTYEALSRQYVIEHAFYTWNQGESQEQKTDPNLYTIYNDETYRQYYTEMHNDLMQDCRGLQFGTIVAVRSCRQNALGTWKSRATTNARRAQYRLCEEIDNLYMVSWLTEECDKKTDFSSGITRTVYDSEFDLVPSVKGASYAFSNMHYTQWRYNQMGKDAADNLYKIMNGKGDFTGVGVYGVDGGLLGSFDANGSGSLTVKKGTATEYLLIRTEDASCTYTTSLSIDKASKTLNADVYTDSVARDSGDEYIDKFGHISWSELGLTELNVKVTIH